MSDSQNPYPGPDLGPDTGSDQNPGPDTGSDHNPGPGPSPEQPEGAPSYGTPPPYGAPPPPPQYGTSAPYGATPPQYGAPAPYGAYSGQMHPAQERTWCSAAHWSALVAGFVTSGIFAFTGPLLVMLVKGNESPRVRAQAVESLNFQISMLIYAIISVVLWLVLVGILLSIAVGLAWLVLTIMAAIKANNGQDYRYPLTLRLVS